MALPTRWTWVWANSGSWWWTERPGMLLSVGLQSRTWLGGWTELISSISPFLTHSDPDWGVSCIGRAEPQPLGHQESPCRALFVSGKGRWVPRPWLPATAAGPCFSHSSPSSCLALEIPRHTAGCASFAHLLLSFFFFPWRRKRGLCCLRNFPLALAYSRWSDQSILHFSLC